jgi:hypothetical protein
LACGALPAGLFDDLYELGVGAQSQRLGIDILQRDDRYPAIFLLTLGVGTAIMLAVTNRGRSEA